MAYTTRLQFTLFGCCVLWKSVKLPSYSEKIPSPVPEWTRDAWQPDKFANIHTSQTVCANFCPQAHEGDVEQNAGSIDMLREAIRIPSIAAVNGDQSSALIHECVTVVVQETVEVSAEGKMRKIVGVPSKRPSFELAYVEDKSYEEERTGTDIEWDEVEEVVRRAEEEEQLQHERMAAQLYSSMAYTKSTS